MKNYIVLFILILVGIYIPADIFGQGVLIFIKTLLLFTILYFLYEQYTLTAGPASVPYDGDERLKLHRSEDKEVINPAVKNRPKLSVDSVSLSTLLNLPDSRLNAFLVGQFEILYNYLMPKHGFLLVREADAQLFLFYSHVNDVLENPRGENFKSLIKIIDRIDDNILIENSLDESSNIIQVYQGTSYTPGSLFAMKTVLPEAQVLYWVFDTPGSGFFNNEELSVPAQINLLAYNTVVQSFENFQLGKKLALLDEEKKLYKSLNSTADFEELINIFVNEMAGIFEAHKLTVAFIDKDAKYPQTAHVVKTIGFEEPSKKGFKFNIEEGLAGRVIHKKKTYLLDDIDKGEYFIPRFSTNEKTNYGLHSFLGGPIESADEFFSGMICLEHKDVGKYSGADRDLLMNCIAILNETLGRFAGQKAQN